MSEGHPLVRSDAGGLRRLAPLEVDAGPHDAQAGPDLLVPLVRDPEGHVGGPPGLESQGAQGLGQGGPGLLPHRPLECHAHRDRLKLPEQLGPPGVQGPSQEGGLLPQPIQLGQGGSDPGVPAQLLGGQLALGLTLYTWVGFMWHLDHPIKPKIKRNH